MTMTSAGLLAMLLFPSLSTTVEQRDQPLVANEHALQQTGEKVYKGGDPGVKDPVLTHEKKPNYPGRAMRRNVQGTVGLTIVVTPRGTVREDVEVIRSLDPDLDAESVKAVKQWRFKPGMKDNKPVNVAVEIELTFTRK